MKENNVANRNNLFIGLSRDQIKYILAGAIISNYQPGDNIIEEDENSRDLYIVHTGVVSLMINLPNSNKKMELIDNLHPGQVFGEIAFVDGCLRSATLIADTETTIIKLEFEKIQNLIEQDYKLGYLLMRNISVIMASKIRSTTMAMRNMMF